RLPAERIGISLIFLPMLIVVGIPLAFAIPGVETAITNIRVSESLKTITAISVLFPTLCMGLALRIHAERRGRRQVIQSNSLLCLRCRYNLSHTSGLVCPECGTAFTSDKLREGWGRTYQSFLGKQDDPSRRSNQ